MRATCFLLSFLMFGCAEKNEKSLDVKTEFELQADVQKTVLPEGLKNKKLKDAAWPDLDHKWAHISSDNVLTFHLFIPYSDETFELRAKIGEYNNAEGGFVLEFIGSDTYKPRAEYKPSTVLPILKLSGSNGIVLTTSGFNTITGTWQETTDYFIES